MYSSLSKTGNGVFLFDRESSLKGTCCPLNTPTPYTAGTKAEVLETYGPIEEWDMSEVKILSYLFWKKETVNADLSKWDVSQVTSMSNSK